MAKDFHYEGLQREIGPLLMAVGPDKGISRFNPTGLLTLTVATDRLKETLSRVKQQWLEFHPDIPYSAVPFARVLDNSLFCDTRPSLIDFEWTVGVPMSSHSPRSPSSSAAVGMLIGLTGAAVPTDAELSACCSALWPRTSCTAHPSGAEPEEPARRTEGLLAQAPVPSRRTHWEVYRFRHAGNSVSSAAS